MDMPDGRGAVELPGRRAAPASISMLGWSHRGARLDVLERVAVPQQQRAQLLAELAQVASEVVLLSTCSRTEVYTGPGVSVDDVLLVVARSRGCTVPELTASQERRAGRAALEHLFRVTAGLESRIAGEPEVCGQVRRAVRDARRAGTVHAVLTPAFSAAVRCAQRVRDVAGLGSARRSWGMRAVEVGLRALAPVGAPRTLVVGSGRMATDVVDALLARGLAPVVAARGVEAARRLVPAEQVRPLAQLADAVAVADLVCCTTSADHDVLTAQDVRAARAGRSRPLAVVDLSVPRNVEAAVGRLPGVCLLGPQDLADDEQADAPLAAALDTASALVQVEVERYLAAVAARRAGPLIAGLRRQVQELCLTELQRTAGTSVAPDELDRTASLLAARLLHQPVLTARAAAATGDAAALRTLAAAFGVPSAAPSLDDGPRPSGAEDTSVVPSGHGRGSSR